jgi:hypothetical protein
MCKRYVSLLLLVAGLLALSSASASASAPTAAPGYDVLPRVSPTNLPPGGEGAIYLYIFDIGAANGTATVTDALPDGLTANEGGGCTGTTVVTCQVGWEPGKTIIPAEAVIHVHVPVDASGEVMDHIAVFGGGAPSTLHASFPLKFNSKSAGFGVSSVNAFASEEDGMIDTQAGSHPYQFTVAFAMNSAPESKEEGGEREISSGGELRDMDVKLPPGLVGDALAAPRCPRPDFDTGEFGSNPLTECPPDTQIGWDSAGSGAFDGTSLTVPVWNITPPAGVAAEFAFNVFQLTVFLDARVRSGGDYGITVHADNLPQREIVFNSTTIKGVVDGKPFLQMPTACEGPQLFTAEALGSYTDEHENSTVSSLTHNSEGTPSGYTNCEKLMHFEPTVSIAPDTSSADTPAGLTADVQVPQGLNPEELPTSGLKNTTVTLPEGIAINPGQATGLVACQPAQENRGGEGEEYDGPASCPSASKVGTDEITTPLVPDKLIGNVYVLQSNPPNLQVLITASGDGVNLKLVGTVHLNEATGQLTTTFDETPNIPFTDFKIAFSGGGQAALVTPTKCGNYAATANFTPWVTPFVANALSSSSFTITSGPGGSGCAWPLPFAPTMTAGATTDQAGGYTSFTMLLQRADGQQRISNLQFKTPEGLLGMLSKVPLCEEPQAASGECSAASQIGHTVVEAGPGPYPFVVPQPSAPPAPIYLTGPYDGAPFGLSIAVPVVAGPFNLGTVTVRGRIEVDPHTSQLTITTSPLPILLKGIPADLRSIDAVIDRPEFMFNPTSCAPMSFSGTATSTEGATAPLESHFQVGSCRALTFKPNLVVSTSSKPSRTEGTSLAVKIVYPTGNLGFNQASSQSNIKTVKVELPKQLPSRLSTLQKACTAATFEANPAACPVASRVGYATAITPVLPVPLTGPAYFVSHGGEAFPSLIVVLQGDGVTVDVVGSTFISKAGITSSTFKSVPDVPIGSFELVLPKGPFSALTASGKICKTSLSMPTEFIAQNEAKVTQKTKIAVTGCPKAKKASHKKRKARGKGGKSRTTSGKSKSKGKKRG